VVWMVYAYISCFLLVFYFQVIYIWVLYDISGLPITALLKYAVGTSYGLRRALFFYCHIL
jgi:hypothetical protein